MNEIYEKIWNANFQKLTSKKEKLVVSAFSCKKIAGKSLGKFFSVTGRPSDVSQFNFRSLCCSTVGKKTTLPVNFLDIIVVTPLYFNSIL